MIELRQRVQQQSAGVRIAAIRQALHKMFPRMETMRWYSYSRHLAELHQEAEEKRLADLAQTETQKLQVMPRLSVRWWLPEDEEQPTIVEEPERTTDADVEISSPYATRKLSTEHFIETEKRAAVLVKSA